VNRPTVLGIKALERLRDETIKPVGAQKLLEQVIGQHKTWWDWHANLT